MEKNIKAFEERIVLDSVLLNENALLEDVIVNGNIEIVVRFVEAQSVIKEHVLLRRDLLSMDPENYMNYKKDLMEINEDKTAIAIFTPTKKGFSLASVYDVVKHTFGDPEFKDLDYREKFPNKTLEKGYFKQ